MKTVLFALFIAAAAAEDQGSLPEIPMEITAKAAFRKVHTLMAKIPAMAEKEQKHIQAELKDAIATYQKKKKRVQVLMMADAELNHIPLSSLDPKNYGLGADPTSSAETILQKSRMGLCDRMSKVSKDVLKHFSDINMRRRLIESGPPTSGGKSSRAQIEAAFKDVQKLKDEEVAAQVQAQVDKKIVQYLKEAAVAAIAKSKAYAGKEQDASNSAQEAMTGHAGTPVMVARMKLKKANIKLQTAFKHALATTRQYSGVGSMLVDIINSHHILYVPKDLKSSAGMAAMINIFQKTVDLLQTVIPLATNLENQYKAVETALMQEDTKLKQAAQTTGGKMLVKALLRPDFMILTKEFKIQLKLERRGLALTKKVIQQCQDPGQEWTVAKPASLMELFDAPDQTATFGHGFAFSFAMCALATVVTRRNKAQVPV